MNKLKPCPFCNGEPYYRTPIHKGTEVIMIVECKQCGASPYAVLVSDVWGEDYWKNAIAEKWNRRSTNNINLKVGKDDSNDKY